MAGTGQIRAGGAIIEIGGDDKPLLNALARASARLKAFGEGLASIGKQMIGLGVAIVTPLAIAGKMFATMGDEIAKASTRTGVSVEALSELAYAAKQSGTDLEGLEGGLRKMQKTVVEAAIGSDTAREALQRLGLDVAKLKGLSPDQQFKAIAESLSRIHDPTIKAGIAMEIFGKSGTSLIPLMNEGAAGIDKLQQAARRLGLTMSTKDARAAEEFGDRLDDLKQVLMNGVFRAGAAVMPMLRDFALTLTTSAVKVGAFITAHKELFQTALKVGTGLVVAGAGVFALGEAFKLVSVAALPLKFALSSFGVVSSVAAAALTVLVNPIALVGLALVGLAGYFAYTTDTGQVMLSALGGYFGDLKTTAIGTFNGIKNALAAGDWKLAADIAWAGLKVAWLQGIAPLKQAWTDFKFSFMEIGYSAFYGIQEVWETVQHKLVSGWIEATALFAKAWAGFTFALKDLWLDAEAVVNKGILSIQGRLQGFDPTAAQKIVDGIVNSAKLKATQDLTKALADEEKKRHDAELAELQKHVDKMAEIQKQHDDARGKNDANATAAEQAARKALSDAQQKLRDLQARAKTEADNKPAGNTPPPSRLPKPGDIVDSLDSLNKNVSTSGTFNGAALWTLGGGGGNAQEKTAKNTEKMASEIIRHTTMLQKIADTVGGKFT